jgi:hypothetical protein
MKVFLLVISLFLCGVTNATTYYISPAGNDVAGNGSINNPWKTLFKATSTVNATGDIIHVNAGTYTETQVCNLAAGVSIEGEGITSVIKSTISSDFTPTLRLVSSSPTNGNQHISYLKFDGNNLAANWAIWIGGRNNVSVNNCTIVDWQERGVSFTNSDDMWTIVPPTIYRTGNTFHNNIVLNCAGFPNGAWGRGCLSIGGQEGMLIYNNTIIQNQRPSGNNGWCIKYSNEGWLKGVKIYNNTLTKNVFTANNDWPFVIEFWNIVGGMEIYNNNIQGALDLVFGSKTTYPWTYWIHDNNFTQPALPSYYQEAIELEKGCDGAIIENNSIINYSIGMRMEVENFVESGPYNLYADIIVRRNLFRIGKLGDNGNAGTGVGIYPNSNTATYDIRNIHIVNNTFEGVLGSAPNRWVHINTGAAAGTITNFNVKNNIFTNGFQYWFSRNNSGASFNTLNLQNNNTYNNGNGNTVEAYSGAVSNYINSGNITSNPLFVGGSDYTLQATSPCIDAGLNIGLPYNGSAPDLGYAEYSGITNAPPAANAGADQTITLPASTVTVTGTGTDTDGTITSYLWTKVSGPAGATITNPASASTSITGFATAGTYQFELKVTDNNGAFGKDTMQVTVNPDPNIAPTANAGPDQTITFPVNTVTVNGTGNDPDGTITTYLWTKVSGPAGGTITNPGSSATDITGLVLPGIYKFELKVTDNNGALGKDTMQVTVLNLTPTANAGADQTIALPTNTVSLTGSGTDTDGTIVSYLWTKISGPAGSTITTPASAITGVTGFTTPGVYQFELKVTDNNGAFGKDTMQVIVNPDPNIAPTANAGADQTISFPVNSVTVSGSGNDPDGSVVSYLWKKVSGPASGTIVNPALAITDITGLTLSGIYKFELKVTDNNGAVGRDTMQVTVVNVAPTANAGADQIITLPTSSVNFTGSGTDSDGTIASYTWTKILGPAGPAIATPSSASTAVTGFITPGTYQFELKVTDNNGAIGKDTIQVIVNPDPNIAPTANAGADQVITLPTNTVNLSGSGTDTDGTIVSYLWTKVAGPAAGTITNPATAAAAVTGLVRGTYQFELKVTDNNGAVGKDTMQVTVNPAINTPNIPPTANAGADQVITLPTNTVNLSGSGTDTDGTIISYLWTKITGPAAGTITNAATAATAVTGLVQGTYQFELRVTDDNGAVGKDTMQVTVNPAGNIPPIANAGPDQTITLPTNTVNLSGSGTDPDGTVTVYLWTKVSGPAGGTITSPAAVSTSVTGLVQGVYKFELRVTDNNGATGRDTMQVTVNPAGNIPPTANAGPDQNITLPTNTVNLSGSGTDADGTVTAYNWTKIAGPTGAGTVTNASSVSTSVTGLIAGVYKFELRVTDNSGAVGRDTMQVVVFAPNMPPTANAGLNQSMTLPTNSATLSGSGNDVDGTITAYRWTRIGGPANYTITNAAAAVTSVTGLIAGVYFFELQVTDNSGATGKDTVQITVNAANIPPVANAGPDQLVSLPTSTITLSGSGTDVDGTIATYAWKQLSGPVDKLTSINTPVSIVDNLVEGVYTFELTVTDNRGAADKDSVTVTIAAAAFAKENTIKIYPNPVVDITTLQVNSTNDVSTLLIVITDIQGKMVYQQQAPAGNGNNKIRLNMSNLSGGTYFVTVYFNSQLKQTLKVIKQR